MSSYSDKLRDPRWQRKRLEIMQRDGFRCNECTRSTETLHVHHTRYLKGVEPWDHPNALLVTLCKFCHEEMHGGSMTGSEWLQSSVISRGGSASAIWALAAYLDGVDPASAKFSEEEWQRAAHAFADTLEEIARERSDGQG